MIKSPLRYPGGKSRAIKKIAKLIPGFIEYREPFLGGGSIFVYLKQKYPQKKFWINDLYRNLYLFWIKCQSEPDILLKQISYWKENYHNGKELHRFLLDHIESFADLKKAAAFFVINRISFSGTTESGGYSQAAFNKRFTQSSIDRVKLLSTILGNTKITNSDYIKAVKAPGKNVFIFLDPPYYSAKSSALYGKNGKMHKTFDHEKFAEVMSKCSHKWLITYDNCEYTKNLFSFANIYEWNLSYGMRNVSSDSNQNGKELFISNYELNITKIQPKFDFYKNENSLKNASF